MDAVRKRDELRSTGFNASMTRSLPNDRSSADGLLTQIELERKRMARARRAKRVFLAVMIIAAASTATYVISIKQQRLPAYGSNLRKRLAGLVARPSHWQRRVTGQI